MYHTKETIIRPHWPTLAKGVVAVVLLSMCFALVMGKDAPWKTLEVPEVQEK